MERTCENQFKWINTLNLLLMRSSYVFMIIFISMTVLLFTSYILSRKRVTFVPVFHIKSCVHILRNIKTCFALE